LLRLLLLLLFFGAGGGAGAAVLYADEPEIVHQFPEDGAVLAEPPPVLQMCFKAPVNVKDLDKGGDFHFQIDPAGPLGGLGTRIVFQPDGYGVALYPDVFRTDPEDGEWLWRYRVVDEATGDPREGDITFTVSDGEGEEVIMSTPPACLAAGVTQQPTRTAAGSTGSVTPSPIVIDEEPDEDDGPDVALLAVLTIGAAGIAAALAVVGYLIRRRVGFWLHRPPEPTGDEPPEEHH
jgi:hypothetical protein